MPRGATRLARDRARAGLFEFHLALGGAYLVLAFAYTLGAFFRWHDEPFVHKLQVFSAVLLCCVAYHAFSLAHYFDYASTGVGRPWAVWVAEAAESGATVLLTLLLLVISKGWMVSKARLKRKTRVLQGLVTILLVAIYVGIFVLEIVLENKQTPF